MSKIPMIDLGECTDCGSCLEICPQVFRRNSETGLIEVNELSDYPEVSVSEAISMCPCDCISWSELI